MKHIYSITFIVVLFLSGCRNLSVLNDTSSNTESSTSIISGAYWITVHTRDDETFDMLYEFFNDELKFPVYFHPEKWGNARYTGIFAGNVVLEVCGPFQIPGTEIMARCNTLIFRPFESVEASADELSRRRILIKPDQKNLNVPDLEIPVGINPVKDPNEISRRQALVAELKERKGGAIGLKNVKELYIGYNSKERLDRWSNFLEPAKHQKNLWYLPEEPNLRFIEDENERIQAIVLRVESLQKATDYLRRNNILGKQSKKSVEIAKKKTGGLRIILEE